MAVEISDRFYGFNRETRKITSSYHKLLKHPKIREDMTSFKPPVPEDCIEQSGDVDLRILSSQNILPIGSFCDLEAEFTATAANPNEKPTFWEKFLPAYILEDGDGGRPKLLKYILSVDGCLLALSITLLIGTISDMFLKVFQI